MFLRKRRSNYIVKLTRKIKTLNQIISSIALRLPPSVSKWLLCKIMVGRIHKQYNLGAQLSIVME
jgi:hypothetical protein